MARARAFAAALPADVVFSHVTACQLWGLTLPDPLDHQSQLDVLRAQQLLRVATPTLFVTDGYRLALSNTWKPTAAERMQSGQIGRPHVVQCTIVWMAGCL